jgi:hypothetical protein
MPDLAEYAMAGDVASVTVRSCWFYAVQSHYASLSTAAAAAAAAATAGYAKRAR